MAFNRYDLGDMVRLSARWRVPGGPALDPDVVRLSVRPPGGELSTWTFGLAGSPIVRDDVGEFHADLPLEEPGTWHYRWHSEGTGKAAKERYFEVRDAVAV